MKKLAVVAVFFLSAGLLTGCGHSGKSSSDTRSVPAVAGGAASHSTEGHSTGKLNVSAAASLKRAFTRVAADFERGHPGVAVALSFDGSSTLANQINQGAPVDVFASADEKNMAKIGDHALRPRTFATNTLVIVTAPGNPKGIKSFADLARPGIATALCAVAQPCGNAALRVEKNTGVTITPVTREPSVTAVLTKVTSGQVDAGLVYVTDARSAGNRVSTVTDRAFAAVVNSYPITVIKGGPHAALGEEFTDLVLAPTGRAVLGELGFGAA